MKHNKINKALVGALCISSLIVCSMSLQQTLAGNYSFGGTSTFTQKEVSYYSGEPELNSATEKYSENTLKKKKVFKRLFNTHLENKLEKISTEKLEKLSDLLDDKLNTIKDETKLAQILALKEVIDDELELRDEYELDGELLQLLNNV